MSIRNVGKRVGLSSVDEFPWQPTAPPRRRRHPSLCISPIAAVRVCDKVKEKERWRERESKKERVREGERKREREKVLCEAASCAGANLPRISWDKCAPAKRRPTVPAVLLLLLSAKYQGEKGDRRRDSRTREAEREAVGGIEGGFPSHPYVSTSNNYGNFARSTKHLSSSAHTPNGLSMSFSA